MDEPLTQSPDNEHTAFREQVLEGTATGQWVTLDVAMEALDISKRRARELATSEGWRVAPGTRPRQYAFADIRRTYQHRKAETASPAPDGWCNDPHTDEVRGSSIVYARLHQHPRRTAPTEGSH